MTASRMPGMDESQGHVSLKNLPRVSGQGTLTIILPELSPVFMSKQVSPSQGLFAGVVAFAAGALVAGASHFAGTARVLEQEGISRAQRLQALPTAAKALAVSTAVCIGVGGAGYAAFRSIGFTGREKAELSTVHDAICLAEEQRAFVKQHFRQRLQGWTDDPAPDQSAAQKTE